MVSHTALVLLLGVLLASPLVAASNFDFYFLVLTWPGSYCSQSICCRPTNGMPAKDFLIRGLWPYNSATGKPVTRCKKAPPFDATKISSIKEEMISYWSNVRCPPNDGTRYWKSTWKTYGACSDLAQSEYFEATLALRAHVDILSRLNKKGIVQDEFKKYNVSEIESAIAQGIGATPVIRCSTDPYGSFQLFEVYICIDEAANEVIECPVKPRFTCPSEVLFPLFDYSELIGGSNAERIEMPVSV